jgi:ATP-dependent Lon protease
MSDIIQKRKTDSKSFDSKPMNKKFKNLKLDDDDEDEENNSDYETIEDGEEEDEETEYEDEEDEDEDEDEEDEDDEEEELNEAIKLHKLHKFVAKLYPSKYSNDKVIKGKKLIQKKSVKPLKKEKEMEDEEKDKKFNFVFNLSDLDENYNSEYESETDDVDNEEEQDSETDEKNFMKEKYRSYEKTEKVEKTDKVDKNNLLKTPHNSIKKREPETPQKVCKNENTLSKIENTFGRNENTFGKKAFEKMPDKKGDKVEKKDTEKTNIEEEYSELSEIKRDILERLSLKPTNKYYLKMLESVNQDIKELVKKGRKQNTKQFYKLINSENKKKNELDYFEKQLSNLEQQTIINELATINESIYIDKPYRLEILQSKIPEKIKSVALQKLNVLKTMEPGDPEYFKMKNWVDAFMKIPFGKYKSLPVNINDGIEKCHEFMENAHTILDECTYGMTEAKMQVMQLVGQWITNPEAIGNSVALRGPPGSGKTSIIKDGISKILGRDFIFIPLGGCTDGSFLEGNSYVYEGSSYGKIVQSLIECKSMNPVFYFDELDKVSDSPRGQEIIGILTHLTDTSQNSLFHDKYFSEVHFDLSKCLFMFSYNDETLINPILKDRMYKILTNGYSLKEKVIIGKKYLIPKILHQIKFLPEDIEIPDSVISYISENFTKKEEGVRNLKRCLEIIYTKLNLFRLVKPNTKTFFSTEINLNVSFPHKLSNSDVDILIKTELNKISGMSMYI